MHPGSKSALQDVVGRGLICLLDIDMQGVRSVKRYAQENKDLRPAFVFIQPTDLAEVRAGSFVCWCCMC